MLRVRSANAPSVLCRPVACPKFHHLFDAKLSMQVDLNYSSMKISMENKLPRHWHSNPCPFDVRTLGVTSDRTTLEKMSRHHFQRILMLWFGWVINQKLLLEEKKTS